MEFRILTLLTTLFTVHVVLTADLKQVNIVYRHGDRSPIDIFPTDNNTIEMWPQGLGWLSKIGMMQHYKLGKYLRERYITTGFLNTSYKHEEILVKSSDEERCLMSAYCNLAGLYPPSLSKGMDQMWNPELDWQPIPVHTEPRAEDNFLNMGEGCPRYQQLMAETMRSPKVKEEEKQNRGFYEFVGEKTGWSPENISSIWRIADTLICEKHHNLTLAAWVNDTIFDKMVELEAYQFVLMFDSEEKARLKGGPLLKDFISNMQGSINGSDKFKMHMYSGHDTTVAALLSALGLNNGISPPYASAVIVELHGTGTNNYVNIFYKNETDQDTVVPLTLPGCNFNCSLEQFVMLTKHVIPVDWNLECGNHPKPEDGHNLSTAWMVVIALSALLLLNMVVCVTCYIKQRKVNMAHSAYGRFDVSS